MLKGITLDRLGNRQTLLRNFDCFRREADAGSLIEAINAITQQALGILTSGSLADASTSGLKTMPCGGATGSATPAHDGPEFSKQAVPCGPPSSVIRSAVCHADVQPMAAGTHEPRQV